MIPVPGPGGGSLSTWRDKKDNNSSKKDDDISKKDDDLYHPWLVENKAKKGGDGTKKEDARSREPAEDAWTWRRGVFWCQGFWNLEEDGWERGVI